MSDDDESRGHGMTTQITTVRTKQWAARLMREGDKWAVFRLGGGPKGHVFRDPGGKGWLGVTTTGETVQGRNRKNAIHRLLGAA